MTFFLQHLLCLLLYTNFKIWILVKGKCKLYVFMNFFYYYCYQYIISLFIKLYHLYFLSAWTKILLYRHGCHSHQLILLVNINLFFLRAAENSSLPTRLLYRHGCHSHQLILLLNINLYFLRAAEKNSSLPTRLS